MQPFDFRPRVNPEPQEQSPVYFDVAEFDRRDKQQDQNLETISQLLKEQKQAEAKGAMVTHSSDLEEKRALYFQAHDEFLEGHEAALRATKGDQFETSNVVKTFKTADARLQSAFEAYANAIRASYQN